MLILSSPRITPRLRYCLLLHCALCTLLASCDSLTCPPPPTPRTRSLATGDLPNDPPPHPQPPPPPRTFTHAHSSAQPLARLPQPTPTHPFTHAHSRFQCPPPLPAAPSQPPPTTSTTHPPTRVTGRHLAMMPHPERCVLLWQWPWMPPEWKKTMVKGRGASPWMRMFTNAHDWCNAN
jgi:hypothetical protein